MSFLFYVTLFMYMTMNNRVACNCPHKCTCQETTVKCDNLNLTSIPTIPKNTTMLDIRFNNIEEILPGTFKNLNQLQVLYLNNNSLTHLDEGAFEGLILLKTLSLLHNEISHISSLAFRDLSQLENLFLQFNDLENIEEGAFTGLTTLKKLYLNNNQLETLPFKIQSELPGLKTIRLDENPLRCDCKSAWLGIFLKNTKSAIQPMCHQPPEFSGTSLITALDSLQCTPPLIKVQPQDVKVRPGQAASFRCITTGKPAPTISWLRNENEIQLNKEHGHFELLDDGSLLIKAAVNGYQGRYRCIAHNPLGQVQSNSVELTFSRENQLAKPRIFVKPEDKSVNENGAVSMSCVASGYPLPEIRWTLNDRPLGHDPRFRFDATGTLTMTNLKSIDQGIYRCIASNSVGATSAFARLQVFTAPIFTTKPRDQRVVERHPVFFSCDVSSDPPAKINWKKNGIDLINTERININPSGTTLTITLVERYDEGSYECIADNLGGEATASAQLTVLSISPPTIFRPPIDIVVALGSTVKFDCTVGSGDPTPNVKWQRKGDPGILTSNEKYEITGGGSLIINRVEYSDDGFYECVVENLAGVVQAFAQLTVRDARFQPITPHFINKTVSSVNRYIDAAIENTQLELKELRHSPRSSQDLFRLNRYPSTRALSLSRAAEVFEQTLERLYRDVHEGVYYYNISPVLNITYEELLKPSQLTLVSSLSGCQEHRKVVETCDDLCFHKKYRTFDGTCNNYHSSMLGSSLSPLIRLLPPRYENNFNLPIGWDPRKLHNGVMIPSSRKISITLISTDRITPDTEYTHMLMQWGQFLDHDLDFVPTAVSNARFSDGRFCNETCNSQSPCFPIPVATDDPRVKKQRCIGFVRSSAMCGSGMTSALFGDNFLHRQQLNLLTSFIDASNVYGSTEEDAFNLRDHTSNRGLLRVGVYSSYGFNKRLLPPNQGEFVDCQVDPNTAHVPCFQAGDHRANEQLGLLAMHTLWFREHNRLAIQLQRMNSHWDGDTTFHEARKIVGAMMQHITYKHWLPKIIGPFGMQLIGRYFGYDPSINPSIANEFASAAFRFGHTLINPILSRLNESFQPIPEGNLLLHKAFFAPFRLIEEGGIDPILRGLFAVAAKRLVPGEFLNSELTERLFVLANEVAQDLAALNIQRSRDHGLQGYNAYRKYCGLKHAKSFEDFSDEIKNAEIRNKLKDLYGHPDNVDLFVGGVAENLMDQARIGPTFICIIADQFKRLRDGDRFWYENPGVFNPAQLTEIKRSSLARVICDNSDFIRDVQKDVFMLNGNSSKYIPCDSQDILKMDLKAWSQCCEDCSRTGNFQSTRSKRSAGKKQYRTTLSEDGEEIIVNMSSKIEAMEDLIMALNKQIGKLSDEVKVLTKRTND